MKKNVKLFALLLLSVFYFSCKQNQTYPPQDIINSETKGKDTSWGADIMVRNIKKGRNGTILIASNKGVFRYDGKSFTNLTSKISLPGFWFSDVLEDRKGNLWLTAWDFSSNPYKPGVYYYNEKSLPAGNTGFQHFTTKEGLVNNTVTSIYEDKAGNIWFGTKGGVSRYDGKSFQNFTTKEGLPDNNVSTITEDKTGKLWIATGHDICLYDGKTFSPFRNIDGKAFTNIWSIIEDRKGNIWFSGFLIDHIKRISPGGVIQHGSDGLWRYDGRTITKVSQRGGTIIEDRKGNIWTNGRLDIYNKAWAISRYDQKYLYNKKPTVTEIMLGGQVHWAFSNTGILEANDGSIWFGGFGAKGGLYRYDGKTITVF